MACVLDDSCGQLPPILTGVPGFGLSSRAWSVLIQDGSLCSVLFRDLFEIIDMGMVEGLCKDSYDYEQIEVTAPIATMLVFTYIATMCVCVST